MDYVGSNTRSKTKGKPNPKTGKLDNVWEKDQAPMESSKYTAPVYKLNVTLEGEQYSHAQAPNAKGSYYVEFDSDYYQQLVHTLNTAKLYLPIAFLRSLARNEVHWEALKLLQEGNNPASALALPEPKAPKKKKSGAGKKASKKAGKNAQGQTNITAVPASTNAVIDPAEEAKKEAISFMNNPKEHWYMATERIVSKKCYVPFRDTHGKLVWCLTGQVTPFTPISTAKANKAKWYATLDDLWKKKPASSSGQPPRHFDIDIKHGNIKIWRTAEGKTRLDDSFWKAAIATVNGPPNPKEPNKPRTNWTVELLPEDAYPPDKKDYCKISHCPFNLYHTWIPKKDWHIYMNSLAEDHKDEGSPIRELDSEACEELGSTGVEENGTVSAVIEKVQKYQGLMHQWSKENLFQNLKYGDSDPDDENEETKKAKRQEWVKLWRKTMAIPFSKVTTSMAAVREGQYKKTAYGWTLENELKTSRINRVSGTRDEEPDQNDTMGGSASQVAREFGWLWSQCTDPKRVNENQLGNGLYMAEWLHLSAYSWGGYIYAEDRQGATSQTPDNLVLGTSETNSYMLRYEKAWQDLFKFETEEYKKHIGPWAQAIGDMRIDVNCEDSFGTIEIDYMNDSGNYEWTTVDERDPFGLKKREMKKMAKAFPFLAYSVDYSIRLKTRSFALGRRDARLFITFYPLRRQFFHRAESKLDALIFQELKALGRKEISWIVALARTNPFDSVYNLPSFQVPFTMPVNLPVRKKQKESQMSIEHEGNAVLMAIGPLPYDKDSIAVKRGFAEEYSSDELDEPEMHLQKPITTTGMMKNTHNNILLSAKEQRLQALKKIGKHNKQKIRSIQQGTVGIKEEALNSKEEKPPAQLTKKAETKAQAKTRVNYGENQGNTPVKKSSNPYKKLHI